MTHLYFNVKNTSKMLKRPILHQVIKFQTPEGPIIGTIEGLRICHNNLCSEYSPECSFVQLSIGGMDDTSVKTCEDIVWETLNG